MNNLTCSLAVVVAVAVVFVVVISCCCCSSCCCFCCCCCCCSCCYQNDNVSVFPLINNASITDRFSPDASKEEGLWRLNSSQDAIKMDLWFQAAYIFDQSYFSPRKQFLNPNTNLPLSSHWRLEALTSHCKQNTWTIHQCSWRIVQSKSENI